MSEPIRRFAADAGELKEIRAWIQARAVDLGCGAEQVRDVVLAVDEACQNIIRHAYGESVGGEIEAVIERDGDVLEVRLRDEAPPVDRGCLEPARDIEDVRPGGLGNHILRSLMDEVCFVDPPGGVGNLLRMRVRIEGVEDGGADEWST